MTSLTAKYKPFAILLLFFIYPLRGGDTLLLGILPTAIVLAIFVSSFVFQDKKVWSFGGYDILVILYFAALVLALIVSRDREMGFRYLIQIGALSIIPFFVIRLFGFSQSDGSELIALTPYMALLSLGGLVYIAGWDNLFDNYSGNRFGSDEVNPVGIGYIYSAAFVILLYGLIAGKVNLLFGTSALLCSMSIVILTASRASMIAAFVCAALVFFQQRKVSFVGLSLVAVLGVCVYFLLNTFTPEMFEDRFLNGGSSESVQDRAVSWLNAVDAVLENPLVGTGLGSFESKYQTYAHNFILDNLANGGLLLAVPIVVFCFRLISRLWTELTTPRRQNSPLFLILFLHAVIVRSFSISMSNSKDLFIFAALYIALDVGVSFRERDGDELL